MSERKIKKLRTFGNETIECFTGKPCPRKNLGDFGAEPARVWKTGLSMNAMLG